jgi:uncharacterized membrane protein
MFGTVPLAAKLEDVMADPASENQGRRPVDPFHAVLTPHRSLGPRGFLLLMGGLGLVSFLTGLAFAWVGAWPVLGFFGLDVGIVYLAFKLNYRAGRLYETVDLTPEALMLTRVHPTGRREQFEFNPYWVQVLLGPAAEGHRTDLRLASHGREVRFAAFLTDAERADFADALKGALIAARGGPRI